MQQRQYFVLFECSHQKKPSEEKVHLFPLFSMETH